MNDSPSRVLVIGVGSIGERHVRCFQAAGAEVSLCELRDDLRESVQSRYGVTGFARLDEAIASRPNAAVIATPAQLHLEMAIPLASSGVHLLIEKPLDVSLARVPEMERAAAASGIVAAVAYVYRAHPALSEMRAAIASGRFGRPVQIVAMCGQHFPFYRPAYREIYYRDRKTGGGAIQDALTHIVNAGEWLVGPIDRLVCDAAHQLLPGVEVEDTVHLLTRQGDVLGCYSLNQHQAPNEATIQVNCERGAARFEFHAHRWRWMTSPDAGWTNHERGPLERDSLFIAQAKNFLAAVERREAPLCTLAEGIQTLRVNLTALASSESPTWRSTDDA